MVAKNFISETILTVHKTNIVNAAMADKTQEMIKNTLATVRNALFCDGVLIT